MKRKFLETERLCLATQPLYCPGRTQGSRSDLSQELLYEQYFENFLFRPQFNKVTGYLFILF